MTTKITTRISGKTFFVALAFFGLSIGAVNAQVCSIGTNTYATLDAALTAVTSGQTIKLLTDINYSGGITIDGKIVIFDLNGKTLNVNNPSGTGLTVKNGGAITQQNLSSGLFDIVANGDGINVTGAGTKVTIAGNIKATGNGAFGIYANGGSTVTVSGNVTSTNGTGVYVLDNTTTVNINGNVSATGTDICGIWNGDWAVPAQGGTVNMTGNVTATGTGDCSFVEGVFCDESGTVNMTGNIIVDMPIAYTAIDFFAGIDCQNGTVILSNNITITGNNALGITCEDYYGTVTIVTIDGKINSSKDYISVGWIIKTPADKEVITTKIGYDTYTDDGTNTVWVKSVGTSIASTSFNSQISVYPNPVKDELIIDNGELRIDKVEICDLTGKTIYQFENLKNKIDVSALSQGIYIVKLKMDKGIVTRKFIKE